MQRRLTLIFLGCALALVGCLMFSGVSEAASPHFVTATAALAGPNLDVSFKEAGLGGEPHVIVYDAVGSITETFACVSGDGTVLSTHDIGPIALAAVAIGTHKGQNTKTLSLVAPIAPSTLVCPASQLLALQKVSYTDVSVADVTNVIIEDISGTFTETLF
jgi:hypothetical protein